MPAENVLCKTIVEVLKEFVLVHESKTEIRKLVKSGGVLVNDAKVDNEKALVGNLKALGRRYFVFRIAKKNFYTLDVQKEIEPQVFLQ